jgi:hypothetical protein
MPETEVETISVGASAPSLDLSALIVALLKGVIYHENDANLWSALLKLQARVRDYVAVIGLELVLDEAEGYAFLRSRKQAEDEDDAPRLVSRHPLSFPISLLLALLRKRLAEFDARGGETRLVLSLDDIVELVRVFLPDGSNETKLINQIEINLNKIIALGFLRKLKVQAGSDDRFEVRRILKAFVDAQWLADFDTRLEQYQKRLVGLSEGADDD